MARYSKRGTIGKVIVLLILIVVLIFAGLFLFDYLNLINAKSFFAPVYSLFNLQPPSGVTEHTPLGQRGDLDEDRYAKRLEALEIEREELAKQWSDVQAIIAENEAISIELEERIAAVDEREQSFSLMLTETDDRTENIRQIAIYMYQMKPQNAVDNMLELDDQDIIDVLRAVEVYADEQGKNSPVSYWFSLMPPARAAEIQRKMANRPVTYQ